MNRDTIVLLHSVFGVLVFVIGLLQILLKKGGRLHINLGRIYTYLWIFLLISGAYLGGWLITIVGIFGFYYALTGARIGYLKMKDSTIFDKAVFTIGGLIALAMLYYAVVLFLNKNTSFAIIFLVFGLLFLNSTVQDIAKYILKRPLKASKFGTMDWYVEHFTRMSISFIAAVTAFSSIQNLFGNNTLNFLMPTVIGTVLIAVTQRRYQKKFMT